MARPIGSKVRERIINILKENGPLWGYEIYKKYVKKYGKITRKNIYYNLKKGVELGEIKLVDIKHEEGSYSWGNSAEKKYYDI